MTIKTETTVIFHYPEECDEEIAFTHDNDMTDWKQNITSQTVEYVLETQYSVALGRGEQDG